MGKHEVNIQIFIIELRGFTFLRHFISVSLKSVLIVDIVLKLKGEVISVNVINSGMGAKVFNH